MKTSFFANAKIMMAWSDHANRCAELTDLDLDACAIARKALRRFANS
jgi:hypothetical protein